MTEDTNVTNGSTLSWASLNLNAVDMTSDQPRTEVPPGTYTLQLKSAKISPYQAGATDIDFIISDGPQAKRHVFASLPSPDKGRWVLQAASILIKALGGTHQAGEELTDTLNRLAQNGAGKITADLQENNYTDRTTGEPKVGRPRLQYFSVQAAS